MRLKFRWQQSLGKMEPSCEADTVNHDGINLLSSLLTDNGGMAYSDTLPWLEEGLRRIETVQRGDAQTVRWGREDWGALLHGENATIYSLNDETYNETMPLDALATALRTWVGFIQTLPSLETCETLVV